MILNKNNLKKLEQACEKYKITQRELEIIMCLFNEIYSNSEIAEHIGIETNTAKVYLSSIFKKTRTEHKIELFVLLLKEVLEI